MLVFIAILLSMSQVLVKTQIQFVDPDIPQFPDSDKSVHYILGSMTPSHAQKSCTASKALLVMRHGAKFPKKSVMEKICQLNEFQQKLKDLYSNNDAAFNALSNKSKLVIYDIMKWENEMCKDQPKAVTAKGLSKIEALGKRWNAKLIHIVLNIKEEDIEFNSAPEERCVLSGKVFFKEFLKIKGKLVVNKLPQLEIQSKQDHRLILNKGPKDSKDEKTKEVEDIYYEKMCPEENCDLKRRIQNILFPDDTTDFEEWREKINSDMVKTMYLACANSYGFSYSDGVRGHAWCGVFGFSDLKMFEGMHDLQYYHKNGYDDNKSKYFGLPMMEDILDFLSNTTSKKFKIFTGHTSNCLSLITGFRLFQDEEKLTVDNMTTGDKMENRKWRSSFIANYACNIMVVVYDCEEEENKESQEVSIYLNEKPLMMISTETKMCTQCPIKDVKNLIQRLLRIARLELISESSSKNTE